MKKSQIVNTIVGVFAALTGVAAMFTQLWADKDDKESMYEELEERYELTPKNKPEEGAN